MDMKHLSRLHLFILITFVLFTSCSTFHLSILKEDFRIARRQLIQSTILDHANPTKQWTSCVSHSMNITYTKQIDCNCFKQSSYASHLFFFFSFGNISTSDHVDEIPIQLHPRIQSITHSSTQKILLINQPVDNYFYRANNQRGAFTVPSTCHLFSHLHAPQLQVILTFFKYTLKYLVQCPFAGNSLPKGLDFQLDHFNSHSMIRTNLNNPLENIFLHSLSINSSAPKDIKLDLEDDSNFNFISHLGQHTITVSYQCLSYGPKSMNISLVFYIPPYKSIYLHWTYSCGKTYPPPGLIVSSKPWLADIVQYNNIKSSYDLPIPINDRRYQIYISYFSLGNDDEKLEYKEIQTTVYPSIGIVDITRNGFENVWKQSSNYFFDGTSIKWTLHVHCFRSGSAKMNLITKFKTGYLLNLWFHFHCSIGNVIFNWITFLCHVSVSFILLIMLLYAITYGSTKMKKSFDLTLRLIIEKCGIIGRRKWISRDA